MSTNLAAAFFPPQIKDFYYYITPFSIYNPPSDICHGFELGLPSKNAAAAAAAMAAAAAAARGC